MNESPATQASSDHSIGVVIIAKNEENMLANCIETVRWAEEVFVVDHASTDHTAEIAQLSGVKIIKAKASLGLPQLRQLGADTISTDWVFYLDADERVTPKLRDEIKTAIHNSSQEIGAFRVLRHNVHYGTWMQHGGWQNDRLIRLFRKTHFQSWKGEVHEHAEFQGQTADLIEPLVHLTHRNLWDGILKSEEWTKIEARLLHEAGHPPITTLRLIKIVLFDFLDRFLKRSAWKDGVAGTIEAMVQTINRFFVYEYLWELQRKPSLDQTYQAIEKEIQSQWEIKKS